MMVRIVVLAAVALFGCSTALPAQTAGLPKPTRRTITFQMYASSALPTSVPSSPGTRRRPLSFSSRLFAVSNRE